MLYPRLLVATGPMTAMEPFVKTAIELSEEADLPMIVAQIGLGPSVARIALPFVVARTVVLPSMVARTVVLPLGGFGRIVVVGQIGRIVLPVVGLLLGFVVLVPSMVDQIGRIVLPVVGARIVVLPSKVGQIDLPFVARIGLPLVDQIVSLKEEEIALGP